MATGYRQEVDSDRVGSNVLEHRFIERWAAARAAAQDPQLAGKAARTLSEHLRPLRAIDAAQSAVGEVTLNALRRHYGFEEGPVTEYFRLHAEVADDWTTSRSAEVQRSHWLLLDGVEALGPRA
jgi:hypothetical protein